MRYYPELLKEAPQLDITGKRKISLGLIIESSSNSTPSIVKFGAYKAFSLPIWSSSGATAQEQVFIKAKVPDQWNELNAATLKLLVALAGTEATPNAFNFKLGWQAKNALSQAGSTMASTTSGNVAILAGSLATYSLYEVEITLAASNFSPGNYISGVLGRIASTTTEITNEIIIVNGHIEWIINKVFAESEE
jgi:hypothetical protein